MALVLVLALAAPMLLFQSIVPPSLMIPAWALWTVIYVAAVACWELQWQARREASDGRI